MSLDLFDRLSLFIDLLSTHPAVFVVERSSEPPKPLDPAPGRMERKRMWIQPYWKGPEDAPRLFREHRLDPKDDGTTDPA